VNNTVSKIEFFREKNLLDQLVEKRGLAPAKTKTPLASE
jgi:hypothetical protein